MNNLLARFAENSFWMGRYMERVENLARILDVNESFARDSHGENEWLPIVQLHDDDEAFFAGHSEATADAVLRFYIVDRQNPNSILQSVRAARENARSLRHLVSVELWSQLNVFYSFVADIRPRDLRLADLSHLCQEIKEGCQLHAGIFEGTTFRDQVWVYYQLGKMIDRAVQTTRLLDMKYHHLLPAPSDVGSPIDISQWNALLRSVAGYHGYRRMEPSGITPITVADYILLNPLFPRSVACSVGEIHRFLDLLARGFDLDQVPFDADGLDDLDRRIARSIEVVIDEGLHENLQLIQEDLQRLASDISGTYFGAPI